MYENKQAFISALETALIMYSRVDITSMQYKNEDCEEFVVITFTNGHKKRTNITGDSCLGLMDDIRRALM